MQQSASAAEWSAKDCSSGTRLSHVMQFSEFDMEFVNIANFEH